MMPALRRKSKQSLEKNVSARAEIASRKQTLVRDQILTAAARLFSEKGYRVITMDDISASLGYTKSVLYYYFKSKNDILWHIFSRSFEQYTQDVKAAVSTDMSCEEAFGRMIRQHALNVMSNPEWAAIYNGLEAELNLTQIRQLGRLKRDYNAIFISKFEDGVAKAVFRPMPAALVVSGILGMCNWLYTWYDSKGALKAEDIADLYSDLLSDGFRRVDSRGISPT